MGDSRITKVAVNMKSKIILLRERDITVEGHLEDPSIAKVLLQQNTSKEIYSEFYWIEF
jgi:hypothetical protein